MVETRILRMCSWHQHQLGGLHVCYRLFAACVWLCRLLVYHVRDVYLLVYTTVDVCHTSWHSSALDKQASMRKAQCCSDMYRLC